MRPGTTICRGTTSVVPKKRTNRCHPESPFGVRDLHLLFPQSEISNLKFEISSAFRCALAVTHRPISSATSIADERFPRF